MNGWTNPSPDTPLITLINYNFYLLILPSGSSSFIKNSNREKILPNNPIKNLKILRNDLLGKPNTPSNRHQQFLNILIGVRVKISVASDLLFLPGTEKPQNFLLGLKSLESSLGFLLERLREDISTYRTVVLILVVLEKLLDLVESLGLLASDMSPS